MKIESDMNDQDIQKFFSAYIKTANPTAVCYRLIESVKESLKDKNLSGKDPDVKLAHEFFLGLHDLHREMVESEERLLGIQHTEPTIPLL